MEKSFSEKVADAKAAVQALSAQEANNRKAKDVDVLFVDPRDPESIRASTGIIPGAISVPLKDLVERADADLPEELASRSRTIIASCQGGPMGALAAHALKKRGYKNVFYIDGGTQGWLNAGYSTC